MKTTNALIRSSLYDCESTGFQLDIPMNINETIKERMSAWPRKLTSVMEIQRQRFSELNKKFKQTPVLNSSKIEPMILPQASRPQPRQQARSKPQIQVHLPPTRRSNTAYNPNALTSRNQKYLTLANLSKILHVLQIHDEKTKEHSDTATETSASTTASAKQRVQQHLQETATRWWRPIRSSDSKPVSSIIYSSGASTTMQQYLDESVQSQKHVPVVTIVSNSAQQMNLPSTDDSKYDESDVSTEVPTTNTLTSVKILSLQRTRQEPLLMQARGMHFHSSDHRYRNNNNNNMNFFQQQRLIRQT